MNPMYQLPQIDDPEEKRMVCRTLIELASDYPVKDCHLTRLIAANLANKFANGRPYATGYGRRCIAAAHRYLVDQRAIEVEAMKAPAELEVEKLQRHVDSMQRKIEELLAEIEPWNHGTSEGKQ